MDVEQRARELLAAEYAKGQFRAYAPEIRNGTTVAFDEEIRAIVAIIAALTPPEGAPDCAEIYCGQGHSVFLDWQDFELVKKHNWCLTNNRGNATAYAQAWDSHDKATRRRIVMHRLIMSPPDGMFVDHIDGDGLNNRRSNLRIVTKQQNAFNQTKHSGRSRFKGVSYEKSSNMWRATIRVDGVKKSLGRHAVEEDAAIAYDLAAIKWFGAHANLNFPPASPLEVRDGRG
jgi:hypothetical protein